MLNSSTRSAISGASTSWSENVDLEIIHLIIRNARNATTFPEIYKAYVEVLENNGVSPAKDAAYYQFLLKLGVIRAPTWGERWDIWQRTHLSSPKDHHGTQLSSHHLPNTSSGTRERSYQDVKSRVPFLATASSDLDEGYDVPLTRAGDIVGETDNQSIISQLAELSRPSPRKVMHDGSRSLVGYTPSASLDFSGEVDMPIRTSTPILQNSNKRGSTSPTPPPYSESVVSDRTFNTSVEAWTGEVGDETEILTPRGRHFDPVTPIRRGGVHAVQVDEHGNEDEMEDDIYDERQTATTDIDPMIAWELERKADEFYRTGLIGRCWDQWSQSYSWIERTTTQIDTVRNTIVLRQTLQTWYQKSQKVLDMPNTADTHRNTHLKATTLKKWTRKLKDADLNRREREWSAEGDRKDMGRAWVLWREALGERRTGRFLRDMKARERAFREEREQLLIGGVFHIWRDGTRDIVDTRKADTVYNARLLERSFEFWSYRAQQARDLRHKIDVWSAAKDHLALQNALQIWKRSIVLSRLEAQVNIAREERTRRAAFASWRMKIPLKPRSKQIRMAETHSKTRVIQSAWSTWQKKVAQQRVNEGKAVLFSRKAELRTLGNCFQTWKTVERGRLLEKVRSDRLLRETLRTWQKSLEKNTQAFQTACAFQLEGNQELKHRIITQWRNAFNVLNQQYDQATQHHEHTIIKSSLLKWRSATNKTQLQYSAADNARGFFLQRGVFKAWMIALAEKKRNKWIEEKRKQELKEVFEHWQNETVKSIQRRRALAVFQRSSDKRLLRNALTAWTDRIIEIKSREMDVKEHADTLLLGNALEIWRTRNKNIKDAQDLAQSFIDVSANQTLQRVFRYWKSETMQARDRRNKLEQSLLEHDERIVANCFEEWIEKYKERKLAPLEETLALRKEDTLMFTVWDKWVGRAKVLPAVQFDNTRMKRIAWRSWQKAFDMAKRAREAKHLKDMELKRSVFQAWHQAAMIKAASKSRRIRRNRLSTPPTGVLSSRAATPVAMEAPRPRRAVHPTPARSPSVPRGIQGTQGRLPDLAPNSSEGPAEPTYLRLRSELARRRGTSNEPDSMPSQSVPERTGLIRALKNNLQQ